MPWLPASSVKVHIAGMHTDHADGLVQERRNAIANALELRLSCTNTSMCRSKILIWICYVSRQPAILNHARALLTVVMN